VKQQQPKVKRPQFEHMEITGKSENWVETTNKYGQLGWHVVQVVKFGPYREMFEAYLEREM